MAGRRRRASTSSVETEDEEQIRWVQETSVMRLPAKDVSLDDLPAFELRNAIVLNKTGETMENALHVADKGPFIVRGDLMVEDAAQRSHLIMKVRSSTPFEIRNCVQYSIGESDDGRPVIWVRGRGFWYEIEPAPTYRPIYNKMCEATTLYYNMMDICTAGGRKKSRSSSSSGLLDELSADFLQYAVRVGDGSTFEDVVERCGEHAFFFIWQFFQESLEVIDWKDTSFYKWLLSEHPDLFKKAKRLISNPPKPLNDTTRRSLTPTTAVTPSRWVRRSVSTSTDLPSRKPKVVKAPLGRSPQTQQQQQQQQPSPTVKPSKTQAKAGEPVPTTIASPTPEDHLPAEIPLPDEVTPENASAFESVLHALEWIYSILSTTKRGLRTVTTFTRLYMAYKFPEYRKGTPGNYRKGVEEVFHFNSRLLLQRIDKQKYEQHEIYAWLQEMAKTPFHPVALPPPNIPYQMVPRANRPQPAAAPAVSARQATERSLGPEDNDDDGPVHTPRGKRIPGQRGGKKSSLRLATTSQKRSRAALESDSDTDAIGPKRSHYFSDEDDEMEDAPDVTTGDSGGLSDDEDTDHNPIKLIIQAERIPSTTPLGPNNTWACTEDNCDYVVRGGDNEHCQQRIRDHFGEHERAARVTLAVAESRGHLPINHLLDKIKNIGEKAEQSQQLSINGVVLPQRIKRKLPI